MQCLNSKRDTYYNNVFCVHKPGFLMPGHMAISVDTYYYQCYTISLLLVHAIAMHEI